MYAVPESYRESSSVLMRSHSGQSPGVTFDQVFPPFRESCTNPSSVPAHNSPATSGDSASANTTLVNVCANPSDVIGPPLTGGTTLMMFRVRSGLMTSHV